MKSGSAKLCRCTALSLYLDTRDTFPGKFCVLYYVEPQELHRDFLMCFCILRTGYQWHMNFHVKGSIERFTDQVVGLLG